ncbi:MAG: hypothetical protein M1831_002253 [Alyxoria varia]|nr:MAG: hypothetical protein M1831_002253 [Alyxoria varia]
MAPSRGGGANKQRPAAQKRGRAAQKENRKLDRNDDAKAQEVMLRLSLSEDRSTSQIPLGLQQSILDVYSAALEHLLDPDSSSSPAADFHSQRRVAFPDELSTSSSSETAKPPHELPQSTSGASSPLLPSPSNPPPHLTQTLQRIKQALYNRDFHTAFFNSDPAFLQAYAARWSPSRTLGYLEIFLRILDEVCGRLRVFSYNEPGSETRCEREAGPSGVDEEKANEDEDVVRFVALGGGAGGEVVSLAGVWDLLFGRGRSKPLRQRNGTGAENGTGMSVTFTDTNGANGTISSSCNGSTAKHRDDEQTEHKSDAHPHPTKSPPCFHITALDIADWSPVLDTITQHIRPSLNLPANALNYSFHRTDLLNPDSAFSSQVTNSPTAASPNTDITSPATTSATIIDKTLSEANIITLTFTLNELYAVSIAKTQAFLLRLTKQIRKAGVLMIVDSPGTYSTVGLGDPEKDAKTKKYPMAWLLDHALLKVAPEVFSPSDDAIPDNRTHTSKQHERKPLWKKREDLSSESQWFRLPKHERNGTTSLKYPLQLENMRYQVHVFERV